MSFLYLVEICINIFWRLDIHNNNSKYETICVPCSRHSFGNLSANIATSSPEHFNKCTKTSPQVHINILNYETICVSCFQPKFWQPSGEHRRKFAKTSPQVRQNIATSAPKHRCKFTRTSIALTSIYGYQLFAASLP